PAAKRAQAPDEASCLSALRTFVRVRLVEDDEFQLGMVEQFHIPLSREQQLKLLDVRQQNARLLPCRAHLFARTTLLRWLNGVIALPGSLFAFLLSLTIRRLVGSPGGHSQPLPRHVCSAFRRLSHIHTEGRSASLTPPAHTLA